MKTVQIAEKLISGIAIRTKNADEMQPDTAKIGGLWQQFYQTLSPHLQEGATVFGVYYQYESDASGEFTVLAGADRLNAPENDNLETVMFSSGDYLVFEGTGEMPQAVINTWATIWDYFAAADCAYERAYTTDFELYKGPNAIEIYIAVK